MSIPAEPVEVAYLAGIFDGEGSILWSERHQWRLSITNTNVDLLRWLESQVGGVTRPMRRYPNRKQCYVWRASGRRGILSLLEAMRPYLIVKAGEADVAIEDLTKRLVLPQPLLPAEWEATRIPDKWRRRRSAPKEMAG